MLKLRKMITDSWYNLTTGMGMRGTDRRMAGHVEANILHDIDLEAIYRSDGLGSKIVCRPAKDMVRKWIDLKDESGKISKALTKLKVKEKLYEALVWNRLYGGSAILLLVNDGRDLNMPVAEDNIYEVIGLQVYNKLEVQFNTHDLNNDYLSPRFGKPNTYTFTNASVGRTFNVHYSRVIIFDGELLPDRVRVSNAGWGDSVLQVVYERLRGLGEGFASAENLLMEMVVGVLKVKGLDAMITQPKGKEKLKFRMNNLDNTRHTIHTYLLDENETYDRTEVTGTGIAAVIGLLVDAAVAACDIPRVLLLGEQSQGLGSEASGSIRLYYDDISGMQETDLQPAIETIIRYLSKSSTISVDPLNVSFTFNPLWALTEKEQAEVNKLQADTDNIYWAMGLPPELIFIARFGTKEQQKIMLTANLLNVYNSRVDVPPVEGDDVLLPEGSEI